MIFRFVWLLNQMSWEAIFLSPLQTLRWHIEAWKIILYRVLKEISLQDQRTGDYECLIQTFQITFKWYKDIWLMSYDQAVGKIFSKTMKNCCFEWFFRYYIYKIGRLYQEKNKQTLNNALLNKQIKG